MIETAVSVIIPAYNVHGCIERAIESAYAQKGVRIEVIVIDDCSSDGTADFVEARFGGAPGFRLIRAPMNKGPAAARNMGIAAATGEWVALLDADDWWKPNRLETLIASADGFDFVADNIMGFDVAHDRETWPIYPADRDRELRLIDLLSPTPAERHDFGYLQPMMRRAFLQKARLSYREDLRSGEDLLLYLQLMAKGGRALFVNKPLYVYAMPVGPISRKASPFSRTPGTNEKLIAALSDFRAVHRQSLKPAEYAALTERIEYFKAEAPIAEFHHARANLNILAMLRLVLFERRVQTRVFDRIVQRLQDMRQSSLLLSLAVVVAEADSLFV